MKQIEGQKVVFWVFLTIRFNTYKFEIPGDFVRIQPSPNPIRKFR